MTKRVLNKTERAVVRRTQRALQIVDRVTGEVDQKLSDRFLDTATGEQIAAVLMPIMRNFSMNILANIYPLGRSMMREDLRVLANLEEGRDSKEGDAAMLAPEERAGWERGPAQHYETRATTMDEILDHAFAEMKKTFLDQIDAFNQSGRASQFSAYADIHTKGEPSHNIRLTMEFMPNVDGPAEPYGPLTGSDITGGK